MRNVLLLVSVALAIVPAAGWAAGDVVPCPDKKAGQWFRYSVTDLYNKKTELVKKIDTVDGERLIQNGGTFITDKMYNWHKLGRRVATPKWYSSIECPFSLGERRVYKDVVYDGVEPGFTTHGTFTVTVDAELVQMTVPAGSFQVVKIVSENAARGTDPNAPGGVWQAKISFVSYYAPEIGVSIKNEFTSPLPRQREVQELIEYSIAH